MRRKACLSSRPRVGVVARHLSPFPSSAGAATTTPATLGGDELLGLDVLQAGSGLVVVGSLVSELGRVTASQLLLDQPRRHRAGHTQAGLAGPRAGAELLLTGVGVLAGGFPVVGVAGRVSVPVVFVPLRLPGSCWVARKRLGWACMGRIVARLVALGRVGLLGGGVGSSAGGSTWCVPLAISGHSETHLEVETPPWCWGDTRLTELG